MSKSLAANLGLWKIGCMSIVVGCILAPGAGRAHAAPTYVLRPDFVTTPTAANESFSVILKLDGPAEQMEAYSLYFYYNSAVYTINSAINNTNSPYANVGLDGTVDDSANDDGDTSTDKIAIIQAAESGLTGWSVPGNVALLNCTTSATFTPIDRILITVRDNPGNGFYATDGKQYLNDAVSPLPPSVDGTWTQTYFLPVGLSSFSIE